MGARRVHRAGAAVAAGLIAALVAGGCSGARPAIAGQRPGDGDAKKATTTTTRVGKNGVAGGQDEAGLKSIGPSAEAAKRLQAAAKKGNAKDGIIGGPDTAETFDFKPKGCSMLPETTCYIDWRGQYQLVSRPEASVLFGVYENDEATPSFSATLKGARPPGSQFFDKHFIYKVRATVRKAVFRVSLVAPDGTVLATGADYIFQAA